MHVLIAKNFKMILLQIMKIHPFKGAKNGPKTLISCFILFSTDFQGLLKVILMLSAYSINSTILEKPFFFILPFIL